MTLIVKNMQHFTGGLYLANNCSKTKLLQELDDLHTPSCMSDCLLFFLTSSFSSCALAKIVLALCCHSYGKPQRSAAGLCEDTEHLIDR